ncbi:transglycosylase SLT domain-containing protein [Nocardia sp. NPDC057030]|uniref:aggregation-promoting factor C-terminal-like domain-containing protein n=1 Tax=unclassified Nocardia TaxID=2637762 RepID=UPI003625AA30
MPISIATVAIAGTAGVLADLASITAAVAKAGQTIALVPAIGFAGLAGVGSIASGASGIVGAFKAASAASKDASDSMRSQRDAAEAIAEAEYQLDRANQTALTSQRSLSDVYRDASRSLRDMNDDLVDQKFATQDAALSVQEAAQRLQKVQFDVTADSTTRARAKLSYDEAVQRLKEQSQKTQDLSQDTAEANRKGVEGSDAVVAARDRIAEAIHAQTRAEQALEKAREDASKGSAKDDALAKAMAKLSPNAKEFVNDVRALGPAWREAQQASQDALTAKLGPDVTRLAQVQLPALRDGMVGINTAINSGLRASLASLSSDTNKADFKTSLGNTAEAFRRAAEGARPLTDATTKLITVGTGFLPAFGDAIRHASVDFDHFIQRTAADGSLKKFMQGGIDAARELTQTIGHIGSAIGGVFRAAGGGNALHDLEALTDRIATFVKSTEGQTKLREYFDDGRAALDKIKPLLEQLPSIMDSVIDGFKTWSGIVVPFLTTAAKLLADHKDFVQTVVVAYLAFKTIAPIVNLVTGAIQAVRAQMLALQGSVGFTTGAMQLGWRQVAASITIAGLAMAGVTLGITGISGEVNKAKERQDALADSARDVAVSQRDMARSFQESGGAVSVDVLDSVAKQIDIVLAKEKALAESRPGAFSVFTGGFQDIKGWFHGQAQAGTDAVRAADELSDANARAKASFDELQLSSKEIAAEITGSDSTFAQFIGRLRETSNGGADAEAEIRAMRERIAEARQLAKDSTPGFFTLSNAIEKLADESSTAADKVKAMQAALDVLSGKPIAAGDALEAYNQQIRDTIKAIESFDRSQGFGSQLIKDGDIDTALANGKLLRDELKDLTRTTLEAGAAGNPLEPLFAKNEQQFQLIADRMGLTKQQVIDLAKTVGYLPPEIKLLASLAGADDVTQKLVTIGQLLDLHKDGVVVPMKLVDQEFRDELTRAHVAIQEIPGTKEFRLVPQTADAIAELQRIADQKIADKRVKVVIDYATDLTGYSLTITSRQKLHEDISNVEIAPGLPRAAGGEISGGIPGKDSVPVWAMPGEHMLNVDDVNRMGGQAGVYRFREALARGEVRGYAEGGAVGSPIVDSMAAVVAAKYPGMKLTSGYRNKGDDYHTQGKAADFSDGQDDTPGMQSLAGFIATNYPGSLELIHSPFGHNIKNGRDVGDGISTYTAPIMAEHRNHVHWASSAPVSAPGTTAPAGSIPAVSTGTNTTTTGTQTQLYPQAALPGRASEQQLSTLTAQNAVDAANSERNAVYANPSATDADRLAADIKYQQAQNQLESTQKSDTSAISLQGIFSKAGSILATGILSGLGLENSVLSESNVYNKSANALIDRFGQKPGGGGYAYQPKNLPSTVTTVTPSDTGVTSTIPSSGPITGDQSNVQILGSTTINTTVPNSVTGTGRTGPVVDRVRGIMADLGWHTGAQWNALDQLVEHESSWNPQAQNPTSTAYGLFQFLDTTWATVGGSKTSDAGLQALYGRKYIQQRYGDPAHAWAFWQAQSPHWYDDGGIAEGPGALWKKTPLPERVLSPRQTDTFESALPLLESINATAWSPDRIDTGAMSTSAATYSRGGHDFSTTIVEPRVADVGDLVALAERAAQAKAIGLMAAMP